MCQTADIHDVQFGRYLEKCLQTSVVSWRMVVNGNTCWAAGGWDAELWNFLVLLLKDVLPQEAVWDLSIGHLGVPMETENPFTFLQHM